MHLETLWKWRVAIMASVVGVLAAMMRFVGLGYPSTLIFDEVYYARGAYSLVLQGFEGQWSGDDQALAEGDDSGLSRTDAGYVVHPMLGKLLIAVGIQVFGNTPYGWRFSSAVIGTLTVVLVALIARHLLKSTVFGGLAGVLLAVDGQHIVMSRTALLDVFLAFFAVAAFGLLLRDRSDARQRLARATAVHRERHQLTADAGIPGLGPSIGLRWWRLAAIVALGLGVGVKWSGLYIAAAFMIWSVIVDMADRRAAGYAHWHLGALVRAVPTAALTVVTMTAVYLATWLPWFRSDSSYLRAWAASNPGEGVTWLPESLRSLWHYHQQIYSFHSGLDAEHGYASHPLGWIVQWRPTAFHYQDVDSALCATERCVSAIHGLGHPLIWWAAAGAVVFAVWRLVARRDLMALTVTVGVLASWLPWFAFPERTMFTFYTVAMAPFVALLVAWVAHHIAWPQRPDGGWSRRGVLVVTGYMAAVLVIAGFFAPLWTGQPIPHEYWQIHMWLPSWI